MGAWSSTLYGNDTSCDVRDTYMGYLKEQMSDARAAARSNLCVALFVCDKPSSICRVRTAKQKETIREKQLSLSHMTRMWQISASVLYIYRTEGLWRR